MSTGPFETAPWNFPISNRRTSPFHPLRVSNTDAQIFALPTLETEAVSTGTLSVRNLHAQIKLGDMPTLNIWAFNQLINLNCRKSRELANTLILFQTCNAGSREGEEYSGSPEHKHCLGSLVIHCGCPYENQHPTGKEKGSTANAALWDDRFFNHQENQHYTDLDFDRVTERCTDNLPSLRGEALRLQVTQSHLQNSFGVAQTLHAEIIGVPHSPDDIGSVTYESFVVQSFGPSFAFLRCSAFSLRPHASSTHEEKLAPGLSAFSLSTLASMSSIRSCGKRIPLYEVLLFTWPLAINNSIMCLNRPYDTRKLLTLKVFKQSSLTCLNAMANVFKHSLYFKTCKIARPGSVSSTYQASNHNVTRTYTMALSHSTQTRPEKTYLWRFLALNRSDMSAKPCRISVEAPTEHDARRVLAPYFILSLAAHLPAQGVCNA